MLCEKVREILPAYEDEELSQSLMAEIKAHLHGCASCQRERQLLSETWGMLGVLPTIEPSPDFRMRLWERINEKEKSAGWWQSPRFAFAAGLLGIWVVGVGFGSLLFFKTRQMQKFQLTSQTQRGNTLMGTETQSVDSAYLKRWGGPIL